MNEQPLKILLVGHACSPDHGSEPSTAWNWAWHLSAEHEVWAIFHDQYRPFCDRFLAAHPNPRLHIHWCRLPAWQDPWDPEKGEQWLKLHYILWQRAALELGRQLHAEHHFDIAHQVTMGTISAPSPLWRLPVPFVWGSLGGGQTAPAAFRTYFGPSWKAETVRALRVAALPYLPALRRTARQSALVLATNWETKRVLESAGGSRVDFFLDCGTLPGWLADEIPDRTSHAGLTLLWSSRHEYRKALPLALEALAKVPTLPVQLLVTGRGPQRPEWEKMAHELGIGERVKFLGMVPREELPGLFRSADAFLYTSLRDSSGSVVLEAMAQGLPILTLNHHGVGAFVPDDAGIKIAVTEPAETVAALAQGIERLAKQRAERVAMGQAGWQFARRQTWAQRAHDMGNSYRELIRSKA